MTSPGSRRQQVRLRRSRLTTSQHEIAIGYALALSREELERSFSLVYQSYLEVGLQAETSSAIRFTKHHLLPQTKVFLAEHSPNLMQFLSSPRPNGRGVGTVTLVLDTPLGLPMESVCSDQVDRLRWTGKKLAEVTALSVDAEYRKSNVMMRLYRMMFDYARLVGVTHLGCAVMRPHAEFYQNVLLFKPVGDFSSYAAGNGLEVQGHFLDLSEADTKSRDAYSDKGFESNLHSFFFSHMSRSGDTLNKLLTPWSPAVLKYFLEEKTDFAQTLDEKTRFLIRREYEKIRHPFPY